MAVTTSSQAHTRGELSDFEVEVLASLYRHRLMTTSQICALHDPDKHRRWTQRRLRRLEERGYLCRATGKPPARHARWFLSALGAELAEDSGDVPKREFRMDTHRAISGASQHLLAVNDVGVALTEAARAHDDLFDHRSWDHEIPHSYGPGKRDLLMVDGVITYDVMGTNGVWSEKRFIELDRGTETVHALVAKIVAYDQLLKWAPPRRDSTSHLPKLEWRRSYVEFPGVVFVFAGLTPAQARRRTNHLAGFVSSDPRLATTKVEVMATTVEALAAHGPFGPICYDIPSLEAEPLFGSHTR